MKINKISFLLIVLSVYLSCGTANAGYYFYVQLKDKKNSPYSISNPQEFLSKRAIERRAYYNVPVDSADFPVNPQYINQISNHGIHVHCTTKWLNGVTILLGDSTLISQVRLLPFVKFVQYTGITHENQVNYTQQRVSPKISYDYGVAFEQLAQMNGVPLHTAGFKGENIHIAVIDAGFGGVNTNPIFKSLRNENRLLGSKDFVNPLSDIYSEDAHGAYVLSTMAAETNGVFVGTAPKASYLLIRTEAATGEYLCEPDFWISGIEYADSAGVDLATTSLGYTTFDDPTMNYTYSDLDGKTARASIAATMAYEKGILLLNSAGNEGNKLWKYISVPADAEGVITVGAVTKDSIYSVFSSVGPTPDGRLKPELCAMGTASSLVSTTGSSIYGNGTSFATPILAGITACYLQAAKAKNPTHTLSDLRNYLYKSGHAYLHPTVQTGYGIPNFLTAYNSLVQSSLRQLPVENKKMSHRIFIKKERSLKLHIPDTYGNYSQVAKLYALSGQLCATIKIINKTVTVDAGNLETGIYIINFEKEK